MKKVLFTTLMLLTLTVNNMAAQDKTQPKEQEELVDSTSKNAIEAFSDTTATDSTAAAAAQDAGYTPKTSLDRFIESVDMEDLTGMLFVLAVLFIIFVMAPVLIIIALFYFIHKNRKEKIKLAQMAMQNGQPIPDKLLEEQPSTPDEDYQKGMRQCFVGVGLMIFLGYAAGQVGFGLGALVFCIGLGKVFSSKGVPFLSKKNPEPEDNTHDITNI